MDDITLVVEALAAIDFTLVIIMCGIWGIAGILVAK